jgi:hypothetical protein
VFGVLGSIWFARYGSNESIEVENDVVGVTENAVQDVESIIMLAQRLEASLSSFKEIEA